MDNQKDVAILDNQKNVTRDLTSFTNAYKGIENAT